MARQEKVPVSERALVQRINRALASDDKAVKKARPGSRMEQEYGTWYSIDVRRNAIADSQIDLETLGRDLGVLKPFEAMRD